VAPVWFDAAAEFEDQELHLHINVKEMLAVLKLVTAFLRARGADALRGRHLDLWLDNTAAVSNFTKGGGTSEELSALARAWLDLQIAHGFVSTFHWWGTKVNVRADGLTREAVDADVVLSGSVFEWLCLALAGVSPRARIVLDGMASPASARGGLPFFSRYHTGSEHGVNILAHDLRAAVARLGRGELDYVYIFPPAAMRSVVVLHAVQSRARVVFILPDDAGPYWPAVLGACVAVFVLPLWWRGEPRFTMLSAGGVRVPWSAQRSVVWRACVCHF
jgi:hypothetical protein